MKINIEDYIPREDLEAAARDAFAAAARRFFSTERNVTRLISNAVYSALFHATDDVVLGLDAAQIQKAIEENVAKCVNNLSSFYVFRQADAFSRASVWQELVDAVVVEQRPRIEERVRTLIDEVGREEVVAALVAVIEEMFAGGDAA